MKLATCHPTRKAQARDLCKPCYDKWLKSVNPEYRARQLENTKRWIDKNYEHFREKNRAREQRRKDDPHYKRKRRDAGLRKKYGITADEYDTLLAKQNFGCAICSRRAGKVPLHVDHDHVTGKVRGILCHQCNWYMGTIDSDRAVVTRIIAYLGIKIEGEKADGT